MEKALISAHVSSIGESRGRKGCCLLAPSQARAQPRPSCLGMAAVAVPSPLTDKPAGQSDNGESLFPGGSSLCQADKKSKPEHPQEEVRSQQGSHGRALIQPFHMWIQRVRGGKEGEEVGRHGDTCF